MVGLRVFLLDKLALEKNKNSLKLDKKPPVQYGELLRLADKLLKGKPLSVVQKKQIPPSGDKHDYMSIGPYWWPDPDSPNGEPYIRKDGESNPEAKSCNDHAYFTETNNRIFRLALAYYFTDNDTYAEKAVEYLRVWFLNPATKMNPNLNFAQAIKGRNTGRGAGVLDGHNINYMIEALGLIDRSKSFSSEDRKEIHQWLEDYRNWLLDSKNGLSESKTKNNHGSWYDVQMMSISLYLGYNDFARQYTDRLKNNRIDYQIENDGRQPEELIRTKALHYSFYNLEAVSEFAAMAQNLGINYWDYVSQDGRSIKKAIDYLYPYTNGDKKWEYKQISHLSSGPPVAVLLFAYKYYGEKKYLDLAAKLDGNGLKSRFEVLYLFR